MINAVLVVRLALKMIFLACKAYQEKFKCAQIPVGFDSHSLAMLRWVYPGRRMPSRCVLEVKSYLSQVNSKTQCLDIAAVS